MKLFGKIILTLAACIIIGGAVSASAYYYQPYQYYPHPYYAQPYYAHPYQVAPYYYVPPYPVFSSESHGVVKEKMTRYFGALPAPVPAPLVYSAYPAMRHVQYGIRTYPVYDGASGNVSYVPYVRSPFMYRNVYVQAPSPGPVILPTYWRQMYNWW